MNKELYDVILKMREQLINKEGIELDKKELALIMRYMNELEVEISIGAE